jgi:WD40 repeat protein
VETGREILRLPLPSSVFAVSFSPDGKKVLTGDFERVSILFDAQTGKKIHEFTGILGRFSPDGKFAVTVQGSTGFIWDVQTGEEVQRFEGPAEGISDVFYAPDGKTVAAHNNDSTVRIWDVRTGQELRRYPPIGAMAQYLTFSPDSQYIVTVGNDGIARFFDVDYRTTMRYLCSILLRDLTDEERTQYNITDYKPTCPAQ